MEKVIVYMNPASTAAEAYRILCTNLLARKEGKKIIEVVGVTDNSNVDLITANLAVTIAQAGQKVLLMDCNLRSPKQHINFSLESRKLSDCLVTVQNYQDFIQPTAQANLFVMTAGALIEKPVETLLSRPMQELLDMISAAYDIVLLDVPAMTSGADAVAFGTKTDGVLLVLTCKKDKMEQAQKAKEMFMQAGVAIIGCILDKT